MTEEELKLAAKNYIKRDGTNAEKLLDSIKLSLTKEEAATLLACMQQCYMDGSIETTKELQEENEDLKNQIKGLWLGFNENYKRLADAKELLRQWLQIAHKNHARCYGFVKDTEQFLAEN